jgi:HlyD family secretion protein
MPTDRYPKKALRGGRKRMWLIMGLVGAGALAVTVIPDTGSSQDSGPRLTYTVKRGDLIVTIIEQGTLESKENTEIKCKVRTETVPITWVIESGSKVEPGDVLVRLATLAYEDRLNQVSRWVHSARATLARSTANTKRAQLAVSEYLEGRYRTQLMTLQKDLAIAESNLRTAQNMLAHAETMAQRGYVAALDLERSTIAVTQAQLNVGVKQKEIGVLTDYTKAMELETLKGDLAAGRARHEANKAQLKNAEAQLILCQGDLANCEVRAEKRGTVIYPTGQPWERVPEIEEGANIYMGQTMLLMPDLSQMQVKLGIRESFIDRMNTGLTARVALPNRTLDGEVTSVASVAKPAAWWNGNTVRYDTVVTLGSVTGLMPGMSAEVEVIVAEHRDVLTIPVAAIVDTAQGVFCWIKTETGPVKTSLNLGDSNDRFTIVKAGLQAGDRVLLNPLALEEAKALTEQPSDDATAQDPNEGMRLETKDESKAKSNAKSKSFGPKTKKPFSSKPMNSGSKTK